MTAVAHQSRTEEVKARARSTGDVEFDAGALASRHGISLEHARAIIERCGCDADCIDDEARKMKPAH